MSKPLRLRQICLTAPRLAPVIEHIEFIFEVAVCYRDPNVAHYGLENALIPIGTNFLEIVSPIQPDTAAGRFISRTRGHGGYMAIFQADDPHRRQDHANAMGVRTAHFIDREAYQSAQLHPRDCRAAFIEFGHSNGDDSLNGQWWPAGPRWQDFIRTTSTRKMVAIDIESPQPAELARHWGAILELPVLELDGVPGVSPECCSIRFVDGPSECMSALVLDVANAAQTLARAVDRGFRVTEDSFHLAGVHFRIQQQADS